MQAWKKLLNASKELTFFFLVSAGADNFKDLRILLKKKNGKYVHQCWLYGCPLSLPTDGSETNTHNGVSQMYIYNKLFTFQGTIIHIVSFTS
jgi:hypothetical protein